MRTTDLTKFDDDGFVLHFGGRTHEVDAFTFGNALVSFAEAIQSINREVNPEFKIEISIDSVGPGSFRVCLKTIKKSLKNLFSEAPRHIIVSLLASYLLEKKAESSDDSPNISVDEDSVTIEIGEERIIVPLEAYEAREVVEKSKDVNRNIARAIEIIHADPSIDEFGISRGLKDPEPVLKLSRSSFPAILQNAVPAPSEGDSRYEDHDALVSIHKAVFERSRRKWEFIWKGFRISGTITDKEFFDRLERREVSIRQGDIYEATLRVHQARDRMTGSWLNERYEIVRMGKLVEQRQSQSELDIK